MTVFGHLQQFLQLPARFSRRSASAPFVVKQLHALLTEHFQLLTPIEILRPGIGQ
jgi:hypothetical protein